jgi:hypothetical protein
MLFPAIQARDGYSQSAKETDWYRLLQTQKFGNLEYLSLQSSGLIALDCAAVFPTNIRA